MSLVLPGFAFGIVSASILVLAAVGFTMQFAISNIFNLAYAETMSVAAFIAYLVNHAGASIGVAILAAAGTGAALSVLINRLIYRPFMRRGTKAYGIVIVSLALNLIIQNIVLAVTNARFYSYRVVSPVVFSAGPVHVSRSQVYIIGLAVVGMASVHLLLKYTRLGKAMRATAADAALAASCGIRTGRVVDIAWLVSGALCGVAGVTLFINTYAFSATTASGFLIVIVAAAILGGVGEVYGAMLGALVIGIAMELSAVWINPGYKTGVAFLILFGVLLVRPQGIRAAISAQRAVRA